MQKFTSHTGIAALLKRDNIDTDAIIPSREMKMVSKSGLGVGLFAGWRYVDEKARTPNPDFILNQAPFENASIIISGANFGCGSSREHAVWALKDFGIRCIIAQSYGSIFERNCVRNGILPVQLSANEITSLCSSLQQENINTVTVDLTHKRIEIPNLLAIPFQINTADYEMLKNGLDPITMTKKMATVISDFQQKDSALRPWMNTHINKT